MRQSPVSVAAAVLMGSMPLAAQNSTDVEWRRAATVQPGQAITLRTRNHERVDRYILSVGDSRITVLNLSDPGLPRRVTNALLEIASEHPEFFESAFKGATSVVDNLRLSPAGVFLNNQKVADLQRLVEIVARTEVDEIATLRKGRGFWGHVGPIGGYFVGAMSVGMLAGRACQAAAGRSRCDNGAFMVGMMTGGVAGDLYGFAAANRETEQVIYCARDHVQCP